MNKNKTWENADVDKSRNSKQMNKATRLIETANAPIFSVDTAGCVTEWNQKLAELSHFSKEETIGRPSDDQIIRESRIYCINGGICLVLT